MDRLSEWISGELKESEYRNRTQRAVEELAKANIWKDEPCHCGVCCAMSISIVALRLMLLDWAEGKAKERDVLTVMEHMPDSIVGAFARRILSIEGIDYSLLPFDRQAMLQAFEEIDAKAGSDYDQLETIIADAAMTIRKAVAMESMGKMASIGEIMRRIMESGG